MPIIRDESIYDDEGATTESKKDEAGSSATLPKSILMGQDAEPGDKLVLTIDAIHDDSVVVSYAHGGEEPKAMPEDDEGEMPPADMGEMGGDEESIYA